MGAMGTDPCATRGERPKAYIAGRETGCCQASYQWERRIAKSRQTSRHTDVDVHDQDRSPWHRQRILWHRCVRCASDASHDHDDGDVHD